MENSNSVSPSITFSSPEWAPKVAFRLTGQRTLCDVSPTNRAARFPAGNSVRKWVDTKREEDE